MAWRRGVWVACPFRCSPPLQDDALATPCSLHPCLSGSSLWAVAGVMGAKKTSELIPFCHPLALDDCHLHVRFDEDLNRPNEVTREGRSWLGRGLGQGVGARPADSALVGIAGRLRSALLNMSVSFTFPAARLNRS